MSGGLVKDVTGLADALGVKDIVQLGVSLTQRGIDAGANAYTKKAEEKDSLVEIAELYSDDYRVKLEDAKRWLEEDGLKVEAVIVKPDIAYKDCLDLEVVATNFELKQKVKPGTRIILKYVTSEIIDASKMLFEESERQKADEKQLKAEQTAMKKESINKAVTSVKSGLSDVVSSTSKGLGGFLSNLPKKNMKNNTDE